MHVPLAAARRVVRHVVRPVLGPRLSAAKQRVVKLWDRLEVVGNQAVPAVASGYKYVTVDTGTPDCTVQAKITGRAVGEDPLAMFTVQDGAIRVSHANYPKFEGEFGHLFWKAPLGAYRIRFEYRLFGTLNIDLDGIGPGGLPGEKLVQTPRLSPHRRRRPYRDRAGGSDRPPLRR